MFPVRELHLEDILLSTGYTSAEMEKLRSRCPSSALHAARQKQPGPDMLEDITRRLSITDQPSENRADNTDEADVVLEDGFDFSAQMDHAAKEAMDAAVSKAFIHGKTEHFDQIIKLIFEDNYPINYKVKQYW